MSTSNIPIILLAAGQSTRMGGRDKLLEVVDGMPLLRRQALMALAAKAGPVFVTLPPWPHPRYDTIDDLKVTIVPVPDAAEGVNTSIRRGVAALPPDTTAAMVLLADLPDLTTADLVTCLAAVDFGSSMSIWRGATQDGKPGHPIIFTARHFAALTDLRGDSGGRDIVAAAQAQTHLIPLPGKHARRDLDTPEAWETWRRENPNR
ncbi:CTP:molybdopterin cytidylyltransferase MocA [Sulfitobacter marinus]|uniref:CTP:molybdopterin cytidylyltransferase MocA n=1 Tax=Sulfitobacter marinus TaxID=394264 RepID=A0A1I6QHM8_9RHOB|nr:nucleotidyltransferase family protein [Sulfitobacter marinus]SFS51956.1 CTP:molybdopterin cytidylyltransferase MocA [Sulfitobacter marinus]